MGLLDPIAPPYDPLDWAKKPFPEKARMVCESWAMQGYGAPITGLVFYGLKIVFYIAMWVFFCRFSAGIDSVATIGDWWLEPIAFQKAVLWSLLFEVLGLGCGSGPLTGRYVPPIGGALHFLRPGTTKLSLFPRLPLLGGVQRSWLDVALYLALLICLVRALLAPTISFELLWPIALLVPLLGVADKTIFLAARAEHYWVVVVCFAFATDWIAGAKAVQAALWFWAGVSKLNHHFPCVVCVMTSNGPFTRFPWLRRRMYQNYPEDLRPSRLAVFMGHAGTALEFSVPIVLLLGNGGLVTTVGIILMLMLHVYITSNVPMGVPLEWNFMVVYSGFFLFWENANVSLSTIGPWPVAAFLAFCLLAVPLLGNLFPARISFLPSMRYYAGNWAFSVWFFRGDAYQKLNALKKSSAWVYDQLDRFYNRGQAVGLVGKVIGFRLMHLHGRALTSLVPKAIDCFEEYEWVDGELVAGMALGWNFGDGHLHDERLLAALQEQCGFEEGELRCIFVESQPLGSSHMQWRIADAKTGQIDAGSIDVKTLRELQPWSPDEMCGEVPVGASS